MMARTGQWFRGLALLPLAVNGFLAVEVKAQSPTAGTTAVEQAMPGAIASDTPPSTDPNRIAAEKAQAEAAELSKQDAPLTQIIAKREEALKYWRLAGDRRKEARTLVNLASFYYLRGEYSKGVEYAQQGLSILKDSEDLEDRQEQGPLLGTIQMIYKELGEYQKALEILIYLQKNVQLLYPDNPELFPLISTSIGQTYETLGERQKQRDYYNQALAFWTERKNALEQARVVQLMAMSYATAGEIKQAIAYLNRANQLDPEFKRDMNIGNLVYAVIGLSSCSSQFARLKQPPASQPANNNPNTSKANGATEPNNVESFQKLAQKYRQKGMLAVEAEYLSYLAGLEYSRVGDYPQALATYQQELKLRQFTGGKPKEAEVLANIADVLNNQGKKQEAINALNQALEIQRRLNIRPEEANTLITLGDVYLSLGAYDSSLDTYKKALSIYRDIGDRSNEGDALQSIGFVYKEIKNYSTALDYYQQAFVIAETNGNCSLAATSKEKISQIYLDADKEKQAIININIASKFAEQINIIEYKLVAQAGVDNLWAKVNLKQGNYPEAIKLAQQAHRLAQKSGVRQVEARFLKPLAEAYIGLKQPDKAIQTYQEQLSLYRTLSLQPEQAQSLYDLAHLEQQTGKLTDALKTIDEAINIIENIRQTVINPELRTSFFATKQDYYTLKIDILMELHQQDPTKGYDAQAFDTSERSRARTLLELLNESNTDIRQGVDPKLLEQENALKYKLTALEQRWSEALSKNAPEPQKAILQQERKTLLTQSQEIQAQIRAKSPKYAALKYPQPLTFAQVQQQILDPETILLQYSLGEEKSYLWVITKDKLTTYILPPQKAIESAARELLNAIQFDKDNPESIAQSANVLSQLILAPAASKLTQKRLLIVPDGVLHYIPFSTLSLANTLLVDRYELINLPSSSSLAIIRQETRNRKPAAKTLAILADPIFSADDERIKLPKNIPNPQNSSDLNQIALGRSLRALGDNNTLPRLPGTRMEAEEILPLVPESQSISAFDFQANIALINSPQMSQYRLIHFATHGIFNSESPELSGVVLSLVNEKGNSVNGFLRLNDIFNLNLPAELVILSACETGLGKEVKGEGLVGLTRGFMYAGSPRVLVSLWKVDDEATAEIMTRFYKLMLEKKLLPAQALREAQLQMQQETEWKSPYYWAAFVLQGEWRCNRSGGGRNLVI